MAPLAGPNRADMHNFQKDTGKALGCYITRENKFGNMQLHFETFGESDGR